MNRLGNKIALVTGAGSGIGKAIAQRFASEGAKVWVLECDARKRAEAVSRIVADGGQAEAREVDVGSFESVRSAIRSIGRIDILVNNAGVSSIGTVEMTTPEEMDRVYGVNVKGVYHCLHHVVPLMVAQHSGAILNLASIASKIGIAERFAYSMSKGAVLSMTLSVARDYIDHGIRCNCICPARVHTPLVDDYLERYYPNQKEEMFDKLARYQPMGRMGTLEEVASLAAFLCSDEASFITGAAYDIDGGVTHLR